MCIRDSHRAVDRVEGAGRRKDRLGLAEQAHGHAGDQAERSLRADEQMGQVYPAEDLRALVPISIT